MKNKKGFTLVELLAVIVILAVIILIAVNAVLPQMRKARRNSFIDEAINFAKAAETAYVSDSLKGEGRTCYNVADLKGKYVSKNDEKYKGWIQLSISGDNISKTVTITDGANFIINAADPTDIDPDEDVTDYSAAAWTTITGENGASIPSGCEEQTTNNSNSGSGQTTNP